MSTCETDGWDVLAQNQRHFHYTTNVLQTAVVRGSNSHFRPTAPHGPHLVGLVKEAAPAPLEQELNVLINTAARKLPGQMESVFKKHTHTRKYQDINRDRKARTATALPRATRQTAPLGKLTVTLPSVVKYHRWNLHCSIWPVQSKPDTLQRVLNDYTPFLFSMF